MEGGRTQQEQNEADRTPKLGHFGQAGRQAAESDSHMYRLSKFVSRSADCLSREGSSLSLAVCGPPLV
jgi:hypothetical protein